MDETRSDARVTEERRITTPTEARETAQANRRRFWRWVAFGIVVVSVVTCLALSLVLSAMQKEVVTADVVVGDGVPVTLYLPGEPEANGSLPPPPDAGDRPPVVVLAHGFSGDRAMVSTFARRLAAAGYGVASLEFRGHSENLNPFAGGSDTGLNEDIGSVLDWLESSPYVDAERVAVMGHSMGADAALDFARVDARPAAVVAVSGGEAATGPETPNRVLFLLASGDPDSLKDAAGYASETLPAATMQEEVTIASTDHITILWSKPAAAAAIAWLDDTFGVSRRGPVPLGDPRLGIVLLYLLAALVVVGASGFVGARLAPAGPDLETDAGWRGRGIGAAGLLLALGLAMPVAALATPEMLVPLAGAGALVGFELIVGAWLLALRLAARTDGAPDWIAPLRGAPVDWRSVGRTVLPAVAVVLIGILALAPAGIVFHNLLPGMLRVGLGLFTAVLVGPFAFGFNLLLRQGPALQAAVTSVGGRVLVLAALLAGGFTGILDDFVLLMVPVIALTWVFLEVMAIVAYTSRRNVVLVAVTESLLTGILIATIMPTAV
ncbi:MAG: alpha/beta hydrolase [Acidimicrobiia bacterium]|nr:alpha/beta hydrolase [Acidimicrobiia bacterium]